MRFPSYWYEHHNFAFLSCNLRLFIKLFPPAGSERIEYILHAYLHAKVQDKWAFARKLNVRVALALALLSHRELLFM
jgi:hypothetical protein